MTSTIIKSSLDFQTISCSFEEQETTITFLRSEDTMSIYTSDNTTLTVLKKKFEANPKDWVGRRIDDSNGNTLGYKFTVPKSFLKLSASKREFSDEQKAAMTERLKAARDLKKQNSED